MDTKLVRTLLIILQIIITASLLLADICGIATIGSLASSKSLIESLVRCIATLAFMIFYYVSVSDSFSSESLIFPLYLLSLTVSEIRILEIVERATNLYIIPQQTLVGLLMFSTFLIAFCLIGYALLSNASGKESTLYTIAIIVIAALDTYLSPISQNISETWQSKNMWILISFFFTVAILVSIVQFFLERSKSSRIKYLICLLLSINNYINLVYNSIAMNTFGTIIYIASMVLIVVLVEVNSTRL